MQQTKVYIFKSLVCVAVQKILQIFKKICTNLINHVKRRLSKKGEPYKKKRFLSVHDFRKPKLEKSGSLTSTSTLCLLLPQASS